MPRGASKSTAEVHGNNLYTDDEHTGTHVGSAAWFAWLEQGQTFYFAGCTFRAEQRRKTGLSWYAFKKHGGRLHKAYVGRTPALDRTRLAAAARALHSPFA